MIKKLLLLATCLASAPQAVLAQPATLPAIAYQACSDLQAGDVVEFTNKADGEFVGVCQVIDGMLVAVPMKTAEKRSQAENSEHPVIMEPAK